LPYILSLLEAIVDPVTGARAYTVRWKVLNSALVGNVAQHRSRVYIVGLKNLNRDRIEFPWPEESPPPPLEHFLDPGSSKRLETYDNYPFPQGRLARSSVQQAIAKLEKKAREEGRRVESYPAVVDLECSSLNMAVGVCPCITRNRGGAHSFWLLQHGRRLTTSEMMRLQGFDPTTIHVNVSKTQMGHLLGNGFTCTVVERILRAAIEAAEMPGESP